MTNQKTIIWINCYGAWDPIHRSEVETKGYNQYLDSVVELIFSKKENIDIIIISGGMVDFQNRTEVETVKPELEKRLNKKNIKIPIETDEESITTIAIARKFVQTLKNKYPDHQAFLVCDDVRYTLNCYLVEYFTRRESYYKLIPADKYVIAFNREDDNPHSTYEYQNSKLEEMKNLGVEYVESEQMKERIKYRKKYE